MQGHTCRAHVKLGPLWEREQGVSQWAGMPFAVFGTVLQCISAKRCKVSACNVKISKNVNCAGALGMTLRLLSAFFFRREEKRGHYSYFIYAFVAIPPPRRMNLGECLCPYVCSWEQVQAQPDAILSPRSLYCVRIEEYSWNGYLLCSGLTKQHVALWVLAPKVLV